MNIKASLEIGVIIKNKSSRITGYVVHKWAERKSKWRETITGRFDSVRISIAMTSAEQAEQIQPCRILLVLITS